MSTALTSALRAHAAGLYTDEAGTGLLIRHDGILHRDDFSGFAHTGTSISDGTTLLAWIDWGRRAYRPAPRAATPQPRRTAHPHPCRQHRCKHPRAPA